MHLTYGDEVEGGIDLLVVGAHPDDAELGVGGIIRKCTARGMSAVILDLTEGEMGSRGSAEERRAEAARAAEILGVRARVNARLPDGGIANGREQQHALIPILRSLRPRVLIAPCDEDRHPDHNAASALVRDANYFAGLSRIETGDEDPWRAGRVYGYRAYWETAPPELVVDISETFSGKIEALKAHRSQFHNPAYAGPETYVASEAFWNGIRARAAYWGGRIGAAYAETLYSSGPIAADLPPGLEL